MDKQAFLRLLDKYQDGTASPAEKTLIEEYYRRLEMAGTTELSAEEEIALRQAMYKNITAGMVEAQTPVVPIRRKNYSLAAAAAVLLIAIGAGSYYWLFKEQTTPPRNNDMAKAKHHDLPPGRDAATLTLADGRTIVLDSANGTISKQGGATVINLNGQVSYAKAGDKNEQVQVVYNTITTARGNQYQLILADGSKVWLNSASSLRFPTAFTGDKREVELDGEGYFEVAKNAAKPFHVKTSTQDVEVLGTHFNVNAYKDEETVKTTLLEGKVKVVNGEWPMVNGKTAILKPGEQAMLKGNSPFTIDHSPDLDQVMAWKNGWFEFDNTDIKTIMRQISRWYDVDVRYEVKPNNETYGGRISRNLNLSNILKMLETYGVHYRLENKTLVVVK
ncbi:MAG: FecR family protein [Niastella sp.]|uniref:FecR family protein n=1 Tax=Niastella sp. TaxID=1869183 RepID=UPI00389A233D